MKRALFSAAALALALPALALDVPYLSGRVVDDARVLDAADAQGLESTLKSYEQKTGRQIVVLTLPSLEGEPLEDFAIKVARAWKLGREGRNDGVLLLVARDDHKIRIEVGYGAEGPLTDASAGRIIRDRMVPRFRAGDYAGGIKAGVDSVIGTLDGSYAPEPDDGRAGGPGFGPGDIPEKLLMSIFVFGILGLFEFIGICAPGIGWFLYFFLIPFWAAFPLALWGPRVGGTLLLAHIVLFPILKKRLAGSNLAKNFIGNSRGRGNFVGGSGWSSGGGGGWSSGGSGGFSGGGGSFGGGGASGSW